MTDEVIQSTVLVAHFLVHTCDIASLGVRVAGVVRIRLWVPTGHVSGCSALGQDRKSVV